MLPSGRRAAVEYAELPGHSTSLAGQLRPSSVDRLRTVFRRRAVSWLFVASSHVPVASPAREVTVRRAGHRSGPAIRCRPGPGRSSMRTRALQVAPPSSDVAARRRGVPRLCSRSRPSWSAATLFSLGAGTIIRVRAGADQVPERPALAMVIAEGGCRHDLAAGQDHKLLYQPAAERSGVDLDALACRGEDSGDGGLAGRTGGRSLSWAVSLRCCQVSPSSSEKLRSQCWTWSSGRHPGRRLEEARVRSGGVEHKYPAGVHVHQEAWIAVAVEPDAGPHHLLGSNHVRPLSMLRRSRRSIGLGRSSRLGRPS